MTTRLAASVSVLFALFLTLAGPASPALAADLDDERTVLSEITPRQMKTILGNEGYRKIETDEDGDLVFKIESTLVVLIFAENRESLQFRAAWTSDRIGLDAINDWNYKKKYSKAYLDGDGDPTLEMDLDLAGGVTVARIADYVETFKLSLALFLGEVMQGS